jgi:hypothetical protein
MIARMRIPGTRSNERVRVVLIAAAPYALLLMR